MKNLQEIQEMFGKGIVSLKETKTIVPATETEPEHEVTTTTEEIITPYLFYTKSPAPENFIQWASDTIPVDHYVTTVDGDLYIAVLEKITISGLTEITT